MAKTCFLPHISTQIINNTWSKVIYSVDLTLPLFKNTVAFCKAARAQGWPEDFIEDVQDFCYAYPNLGVLLLIDLSTENN